MKWTPQHKETLTTFWNNHTDAQPYKDERIAQLFGTTTWAVAKMRSIMGLVDHKVPYHNRVERVAKVEPEIPNFVLYYRKDDQDHYNTIRDANTEFDAKAKARFLMYKLGLKTAYVFKPHCQLITKEIVEVNL